MLCLLKVDLSLAHSYVIIWIIISLLETSNITLFDFPLVVFYYSFHPLKDDRPCTSLLKTVPCDRVKWCVRINTTSPRFRLTTITPVEVLATLTTAVCCQTCKDLGVYDNLWKYVRIWPWNNGPCKHIDSITQSCKHSGILVVGGSYMFDFTLSNTKTWFKLGFSSAVVMYAQKATISAGPTTETESVKT